MNVLAISGSPRKNGNTETVMSAITDLFQEEGYDVNFYRLNDAPLTGCQACKYCRTKGETCVLDDPITDLLEQLKQADIIVIGAPNYMGTISGQLKIFLDRMYSLKDSNRTTRVTKAIKGILIFSQGHSDESAYTQAYSSVEKILGSNNIEIADTIVASGVEVAGEVINKVSIMEKAKNVARTL